MRDRHKAIKAKGDPNTANMITRLSEFDRVALIEEWQTLFGTLPAKNISSAILIRTIANEIQCRT